MSKPNSQRATVMKKLLEDGEADNFWAIDNYILRLGAIIHKLRQEGFEIVGMWGKDRGYDPKFDKNYYYILTSKRKVDVF